VLQETREDLDSLHQITEEGKATGAEGDPDPPADRRGDLLGVSRRILESRSGRAKSKLECGQPCHRNRIVANRIGNWYKVLLALKHYYHLYL
jgi:hypothetical protein